MNRITVMLVENHTVVRQGLRALLGFEQDIEVIAEAQNGHEAVELAKPHRPEVIIMDIAMPLLNGLEATRQILKKCPGTKIIILSAHSDDEYVEQALALGAVGYVTKDISSDVLGQAVREVRKGHNFLSPAISRRLRKRDQQTPDRRGILKRRAVTLTSREVEVLQLVAEGKANKQIADVLGISIKTVEKHRQHLMEKLNIHDTAGLTRYAMETGVIESSFHLSIV